METQEQGTMPSRCPVCSQELYVTRLQCSACDTEVNGSFALNRLATLREPHASLLEMFLRVRGNVKEMERELGLSYPTVRARLEEAFVAAGFERQERGSEDPMAQPDLAAQIQARVDASLAGVEAQLARLHVELNPGRLDEAARSAQRKAILDRLENKEITAAEAAALLRELKGRS